MVGLWAGWTLILVCGKSKRCDVVLYICAFNLGLNHTFLVL